jgi:hypothetical protein
MVAAFRESVSSSRRESLVPAKPSCKLYGKHEGFMKTRKKITRIDRILPT